MVLAGEAVEEPQPRPPEVLADDLRAARFRYRALDADGKLGDWTDKWETGEALPLQVEITLRDAGRSRLAAVAGGLAAGRQLTPVPARGCRNERGRADMHRGAALLLVMWLIALLAALIGGFALAARIEHMQERRAQPRFRRRAGGARRRRICDRAGRRQRPDAALVAGRPRLPVALRRHPGRDRIIDENGKVDLNSADAPLLAACSGRWAVARRCRRAWPSAILDWRDADSSPSRPGGAEDAGLCIRRLALRRQGCAVRGLSPKCEQVLGMTPALYALAATYLTVYTGTRRNPIRRSRRHRC